MAETITVVPASGGYDSDGNPLPLDPPIPDVPTLGVAPGNTLLKLGIGGELDDVVFTVYLDLGSPVKDNDTIVVRGKTCRARIAEWKSPKTFKGGLAVLCRSVTGAQDRG